MAIVFGVVEWIALIVIVSAVLKMLVFLVNPKGYMNFAKGLMGNKVLAQIVGLVLGAVVLYYLVQGGVSIVTILAVMALFGALMMIGLASEFESLLKKYDAMIKKGQLLKKFWFYTLIWLALLVWGVVVLFKLI